MEHCTFLTELLRNKQVARPTPADRKSPFAGQSNQASVLAIVAENLRINPGDGYSEGRQRSQKLSCRKHPGASRFHSSTGMAINKQIQKTASRGNRNGFKEMKQRGINRDIEPPEAALSAMSGRRRF